MFQEEPLFHNRSKHWIASAQENNLTLLSPNQKLTRCRKTRVAIQRPNGLGEEKKKKKDVRISRLLHKGLCAFLFSLFKTQISKSSWKDYDVFLRCVVFWVTLTTRIFVHRLMFVYIAKPTDQLFTVSQRSPCCLPSFETFLLISFSSVELNLSLAVLKAGLCSQSQTDCCAMLCKYWIQNILIILLCIILFFRDPETNIRAIRG